MEEFLLVCVLGLLGMILVNRSRQKKERAEDRKLIRDLTTRLYSLEEAVSKFKRVETELAPSGGISPSSTRVVAPPPTAVKPEAKPPVEVVEAQVKAPSVQVLLAAPPVRPVAPPVPPPQFTAVSQPPARPLKERIKSALDLEEVLGTNWLNKLGIGILVLGVAFFLAYKLPTLSPLGKVLVGYATSAVILGGGIWLERKDRYRIIARAGVGGGWALLFFTTYALYHVPAAQVIQSQLVDLILLLALSAVMVWHTLHYRSQVVTGLAYLLAFLTVAISHSNVYSLTAGSLLAIGLVVLVVRYQWYQLEVFGILASYLNHFLWLRPIIEPMQGQHLPFPEFPASAGVLVLYWVIFRISYVMRRPENSLKERISSAAALLNPALLLAVLKYQSAHKEWAFWGLLAIGAIETALGQLPITRRRRSAVIVLSTLGVVLLVAAFPFRYSGMNLSILWLVEAEALVLIGVWTQEIVFRRLGMLAALLVSGHMVIVDAYGVYMARTVTQTAVSSDFPLALFFAVAAIVFYGDAHWVSRRWAELFAKNFDRQLVQKLSYVAALMAFIAAWLAFPEAWTAVAWCVLAAALAWAGRRFNVSELFYQANVLSAAGIGRVLLVNLYETENYGHFSLRLITVSLVAVLLYLTAHWSWETGEPAQPSAWRRLANAGYTWTASILLALLVWYELHEHHYAAVAVAWAAGGLILAFVGRKLSKRDLTFQANAAACAAIARTGFVNYDAAEVYHHLTLRLITVTAVAVLLYVSSRWSWIEDSAPDSLLRWMEDVYIWAGSFLLALLAWYELRPVSVAVAWMVGGLVLLELGLIRKSISLRVQAYIALVFAFGRIFFVNLNASGQGISPRLYTVIPIALALFYTYWRLLESQAELNTRERKAQLAEFFCWLGTVTVVALLRFELQPDWVATGWAALALALIALAWLGRRVFLHQALLLSFGILFRTVLHNFYERSYFPPESFWQSRWVLVGSTVALMFLALPFLFRLRKKDAGDAPPGMLRKIFGFFDRHPEQLFFFIATGLLSTVLALEMSRGMMTLSWGLEGLAIFLVALLAGERSFRLTGLGLLLLCVAKILFRDVWQLQPSDRYLTLIVLGAALLLVSFLYTRYREKILQYL